jgi:PAS domain-containing protein
MRRDGSIFPAVLTISPIRDESGKTVALSVIARDITERKRVENELRRANEDLVTTCRNPCGQSRSTRSCWPTA